MWECLFSRLLRESDGVVHADGFDHDVDADGDAFRSHVFDGVATGVVVNGRVGVHGGEGRGFVALSRKGRRVGTADVDGFELEVSAAVEGSVLQKVLDLPVMAQGTGEVPVVDGHVFEVPERVEGHDDGRQVLVFCFVRLCKGFGAAKANFLRTGENGHDLGLSEFYARFLHGFDGLQVDGAAGQVVRGTGHALRMALEEDKTQLQRDEDDADDEQRHEEPARRVQDAGGNAFADDDADQREDGLDDEADDRGDLHRQFRDKATFIVNALDLTEEPVEGPLILGVRMGHHDDALFRLTGGRDDGVGVVGGLFREQEVVEFVITKEFEEQRNEGQDAEDERCNRAPVPVHEDGGDAADDGEGNEPHERLAMYLEGLRIDFGSIGEELLHEHLLAFELLFGAGRPGPAGADDVGDDGHTFCGRFL